MLKSYLVKTPKLVQRIFPKRVWAFPSKTKTVYLTFDDGPIPEVTPWVLSLLKKHKARATFFCIGDNVGKHPDVFKTILSEGHTFGNHTFHHVNGKNTALENYVEDVIKAEKMMTSVSSTFEIACQTPSTSHQSPVTKLFRPPYGRLNGKQAQRLRGLGYKIMMWDVLSADFDQQISEEKCLQNVLKNIQPGSIVIFHDSLKAEKNLRYALPKVLEYCDSQHWKCAAIDNNLV